MRWTLGFLGAIGLTLWLLHGGWISAAQPMISIRNDDDTQPRLDPRVQRLWDSIEAGEPMSAEALREMTLDPSLSPSERWLLVSRIVEAGDADEFESMTAFLLEMIEADRAGDAVADPFAAVTEHERRGLFLGPLGSVLESDRPGLAPETARCVLRVAAMAEWVPRERWAQIAQRVQESFDQAEASNLVTAMLLAGRLPPGEPAIDAGPILTFPDLEHVSGEAARRLTHDRYPELQSLALALAASRHAESATMLDELLWLARHRAASADAECSDGKVMARGVELLEECVAFQGYQSDPAKLLAFGFPPDERYASALRQRAIEVAFELGCPADDVRRALLAMRDRAHAEALARLEKDGAIKGRDRIGLLAEHMAASRLMPYQKLGEKLGVIGPGELVPESYRSLADVIRCGG